MAALYWSLTIFFLYISSASFVNDANNTLWPSKHLKNGQTLVSSNNRFELGFFSASYSNQEDSWYLGIWYSGIEPLTVVWVANRMKPLSGFGLKLFINHIGNLLLHDSKNLIYLARTNQPLFKHSLVLLDSGNLVIIEDCNNSSGTRYVWQSFDSPSDTLLPGMKLGWNLMGNHVLTSWRMSKDPFPGEFMFRIESPELPQLLLEKYSVPQSRWGPWDGHRFSGTNALKDNPVFRPVYHHTPEELDVYFTFEMLDDSVLLRLVVNSNGAVQFLRWKNSSRVWVPMVTLNRDDCDRYGACGPYGICHAEDPNCRCLRGFRANSPNDWGRLDNSDGCRRKYALNCSSDGFVKFGGVKLPDNFTIKSNLSTEDCGGYCLKECKCMAYANIDVYGNGNKCVVWLGPNLIDIRDDFIFNHGGDGLYIRMARAELARKRLLNWEKRFNILKGIAKGLDYLHCGSRLRIIHRDLKASNILLDDAMDPKISDFGLARNFENEREAITRRAWKLWMEGKDMELKDPVLEEEAYMESEVTRCIQIGLLCVQHNSEERPTMSQVVGMLENENVGLLNPREPGFFSGTRSARGTFLGWNHESANGLTVTTLVGRP
ncbi:hypothetical protein ACJIZ3_013126 [Penstemon smallii]|uniref:non-specific serine/threonine protein kinase n=1 Tax=Penstemon smallii TaxID=265156 RepID=A0ABD3UNZ3_9LAMI